jgi:hypothetical protein
VKWSNCPTGDHNRAKGKEGYPTLGFQCITDFNRRVMAIYGPQFGSRNDKDMSSTTAMFVPSGKIACLPIQRGSIMMETGPFERREVCT